jgi:hypothetical protein
MQLFQKKHKLELDVSYVPIESDIWLKTTAPERLVEVKEGSFFPFFIKLMEKPFENWMIELHEIKGEDMVFITSINFVPKEVDDEQIKSLTPKLKKLLSRVCNDIVIQAVRAAEKKLKAE